jgi:hypothetical protein
MKDQVNIYHGYQWKDSTGRINKDSVAAFKKIHDSICKDRRIKKNAVNFRRLRASAGGILFLDIFSMIKNADLLIFDITALNSNVLIELGTAYGYKLSNGTESNIFIIEASEINKKIIPSNLLGFFITSYKKSKKNIVFSDQNSLLQSIKSRIISLMNERLLINSHVDEI